MPGSPSTPRRKIVNSIDVPAPRSAKKQRATLQDRLAGAGASATKIPRPSSHSSGSSGSTPLSIPSTPGPSRELSKSSDKVVVCVRIKPTASLFAQHAYEVSPHSLTLSNTHPNVVRRGGKAGREAEYTYNFDTLVQFPTRTPELYNDKIAPLVLQAMNGFNSTVFAYGQTGSGKSHTMVSHSPSTPLTH
jgi:centromeric protein E